MDPTDNCSAYQVWDEAPHCPVCDAPLEYWTAEVGFEDRDLVRDGVDADGHLRCCRCAFDAGAEGTTEVEVLELLFVKVGLEYERAVVYEVHEDGP